MGREAFVQATYDGRSAETKAALESQGILLRAPFSVPLLREAMRHLAVENDALTGDGPRGRFELALGAAEAARWKTALEKPLPTLAEKLGVKPGLAVWLPTDPGATELTAALAGAVRTGPGDAALAIIQAGDAPTLTAALESAVGYAGAIWVVHGKGKTAGFGETPVRALMRDRGFIDTKVSAVSATLSATRFSRR